MENDDATCFIEYARTANNTEWTNNVMKPVEKLKINIFLEIDWDIWLLIVSLTLP